MRRRLDVTELRRRTHIPDLLLREQIVPFIYKRTGVYVTETRIGRWIASGDLLMLRRTGRGGFYATRKRFVDDLIKKYTAS